jgi:hypothetical protein
MTYALSLLLWMATAQTAAQPAPVPAAAGVQCPPSDGERALRAQLDEARRRLTEAEEQVAKLKDEASMPDHAVAALLVSDHPDLAPLERFSWRNIAGAGRWRIRRGELDVYVSRHTDETMTAVVLTLRNPPEAPTWEPKEASITGSPFPGDPPVPVAVQSSPERIRPGQTARIALVFDRLDVDFSRSYATLALLRDGDLEMYLELRPSDFEVASATSGGHK